MSTAHKTNHKVFKHYADRIFEISEHYEDCRYSKRPESLVPINECACDCYEKQIFEIGREAQSDLFYGRAPKKRAEQ